MKRLIWFVPLVLMAQVSYGQLLQVNQTVLGMDCAPCAHGVQEGLQKMEGIDSAKVSLDKGKAYITLNPFNTLTLSEIQKEITDNGFSPRDAAVKMKGTLKKINGRLVIQVQHENFWIDGHHSNQKAIAGLNNLDSGVVVTVSGQVKNLSSSKHMHIWQMVLKKFL